MIHAGEVPATFFYIERGCIKMTALGAEGQDVPLHIFYPGACVSLLFLSEATVPYDFVALNEVQVRLIPRAELEGLLANNSAISLWFLRQMTKGMGGLLKRLERQLTLDAYHQVASVLLYFARHRQDLKRAEAPVKITHQVIADWLGLSRENVSIQMKKLEAAGYITRDETGAIVPQPSALTSLVNETNGQIEQ